MKLSQLFTTDWFMLFAAGAVLLRHIHGLQPTEVFGVYPRLAPGSDPNGRRLGRDSRRRDNSCRVWRRRRRGIDAR